MPVFLVGTGYITTESIVSTESTITGDMEGILKLLQPSEAGKALQF